MPHNAGPTAGPTDHVRSLLVSQQYAAPSTRWRSAGSMMQTPGHPMPSASELVTVPLARMAIAGQPPSFGMALLPDMVHQDLVKVMSVVPDGPAAKAGVVIGMRLVAIEGQAVSSMEQVRYVISQTRDGAHFTFDRQGLGLNNHGGGGANVVPAE